MGNPANTNCLIAMNNAQDIPRERFTAMLRLDHNRAVAQLANKVGASVSDVSKMGVWGNHSPTMYPDLFHAEIKGEQAAKVVDDQAWIENDFLPNVGKRGAAIIEARGASSAASAANAAIDHMRDWVSGTSDWVSMGVPSDGSYGVPEGLISGFPCTCCERGVVDRAGPRHRRLLPLEDRRLGRRADRRARHGLEPGAYLNRPLNEETAGSQMRPGRFVHQMLDQAGWVPASALLLDLLFLLETREYAVQVVLLDTHLGGQLGDRDPWLSTDELQGLRGTCATALATARTATGRCGGGGGSRGRARRPWLPWADVHVARLSYGSWSRAGGPGRGGPVWRSKRPERWRRRGELFRQRPRGPPQRPAGGCTRRSAASAPPVGRLSLGASRQGSQSRLCPVHWE